MKVGDLVTHIAYGWKGRIQGTNTIDWSNMPLEDDEWELYQVKWYNTKKKYNGLYDARSIAPQLSRPPSGSALGDWLSTPAEKLRNALAAKTERTQLANTRRKPRRLDGR